MTPELTRLLAEAKQRVDSMTPEQLAEMRHQQAQSWVRAEMDWPKPRFHIKPDGARVYHSYEDYCND